MQAWRCLRHWLMPSSVMLCYIPTHASNRCRLKSFTSCTFCGRLAAPDFVTLKCIEATAVRWPEVWNFYGSLTLLHFPTGGTNDVQNVIIDTACRKDNNQQNCFMHYISRSLQMTEDTIIVFISSWQTMNKLQSVLINVLIRSIFEH